MTSLEQHLKASRCIHYYWMSFFSVALYFGSCDAKGWVIIQYCIIAQCTLSGTVIMQTDVVIIPTDPNFNYRWWNLAAGLVHSNAPRGFLSDVLITWHLSESDTVLEKTLTMKIYHIDIDTAALPPVQCVLYIYTQCKLYGILRWSFLWQTLMSAGAAMSRIRSTFTQKYANTGRKVLE